MLKRVRKIIIPKTNLDTQEEYYISESEGEWRLLLFTFIITNLFFREISKKIRINNKIISIFGGFIFSFLSSHYNQNELLESSLIAIKPIFIHFIPTLSFIVYSFNIKFARYEKIFRSVLKMFLIELTLFGVLFGGVKTIFGVSGFLRFLVAIIFCSMMTSIDARKSAMTIHIAAFKYSRLLLILVLYSHLFNTRLRDIAAQASLKITFLTMTHIVIGLIQGTIVGCLTSIWSRKIIRDNQTLLLLPIGSLVFLSFVNDTFNLNHAYYSAYCSFSLTFKNLGFSQYKLTDSSNNIINDLSVFLCDFIENCMFFIFGLLIVISIRNLDEGNLYILHCILKALLISFIMQALRFLFIYLGKHIVYRGLNKREKMRKREIFSFIFSEKYTNFSILLLYSFWDRTEFLDQRHFVTIAFVLLIHSTLQEIFFLVIKLNSWGENKIIRKEGRYEVGLKLGVERETFNMVINRLELMKNQSWNFQIDSNVALKGCNLTRTKNQIADYMKILRKIEKKDLIEQELQYLSNEKILLNDQRFLVFMLIKSLLYEYYEKGILSTENYELMSEACDQTVEETKDRLFWRSIINGLPSIDFLEKVDKVYDWLGYKRVNRYYLINKLTKVYEISTVIEKCFEEVKNEKDVMKGGEETVDAIFEEFDEILHECSEYMKNIELSFCDFINTVRTKRTCNELLKFKERKYSHLAKKAGLKFEEIEKERKMIIQDMNKLEEFKFKDEENDTPLDFIRHSKLFDKLDDEWFEELSDKIIAKNIFEDNLVINLNDEYKGIHIVKNGILSLSKGQMESNLGIGDIVGLEETVEYFNGIVDKKKPDVIMKYTVKGVNHSSLIFIEKDTIIDLAKRNEDFFEAIYKLYYQTFIRQTNSINEIREIYRSTVKIHVSRSPFTLPDGGFLINGEVELEIFKHEQLKSTEKIFTSKSELESHKDRNYIPIKNSIVLHYPAHTSHKEKNLSFSRIETNETTVFYNRNLSRYFSLN